LLELLGDRAHEVAALVPPRRRPQLEAEVAARGVAGLTDLSDPRPGPDPLALGDLGLAPQVHVDVVAAGLLAVDDEVVPGGAVVALELDLAGARRLERGGALREHVLALVGVARAPRAAPAA